MERGRGSPARESHAAGYNYLDNLIITIHDLPPLQALPISHRGERETRGTSDKAQGTMKRRCRGREAVFLYPPQPLPLSRPCPLLTKKAWGGLSAHGRKTSVEQRQAEVWHFPFKYTLTLVTVYC